MGSFGRLVWIGALVPLVVGCAGTAAVGLRPMDLKLEGPNGATVWQLERGQGGLDLEDAKSATVTQFRLDGDVIRFRRGASDLAVVRQPGEVPEFHVVLADSEAPEYVFRREPDGDFRLEQRGAVIAKVKARDYGYKIEPADGSERKLRVKPDKILLRNAADEEVLSTKSVVAPLGVACFGIDEIPIEVRAALCIAVWQWRAES
ncbi:MAG: hypothetical protein AB7O52_03560 [Planctomycetota bacterium]